MFAQIFFQKKICSLLEREVRQKKLAPVLLLSGGALSAKTEMALEIARAYNCLEEAKDNCHCHHCQQFQGLKFPGLQLLGSSEISQRYQVLSNIKEEQGFSKEQLHLLQQIQLRCSPLLYQSSQDAKLLRVAEPIVEFLLSSASKVGAGKIKELDKTVANAAKFLLRPTTLAQLRLLQNWSQQSSSYKKVAILTRVENLSLAAINALLKTLEEPAADFLIILTTRLVRSLPATLLSRLRHYQLKPLNMEEEQQLIKQLYPKAQTFSLKNLFNRLDDEQLHKEAEQFLQGVEQQQPFVQLPLEVREQQLETLVESITAQLACCYPLEWRLFWAKETASLYRKYHEYNINEKLLLRHLYQCCLQFSQQRKSKSI